MNAMNKLEKAKEIIEKFYKYADCGLFDTRNVAGDRMENLYDDGELMIGICCGWFGLNGDEFYELKEFYRGLGEHDG